MRKGLLVGALFGGLAVLCIMFAAWGITYWDLRGFWAAALSAPALASMSVMGMYLMLNESVTLPLIKGVGYAFFAVVALGLVGWWFTGMAYVSPDTPNGWIMASVFLFFYLPFACTFWFMRQNK